MRNRFSFVTRRAAIAAALVLTGSLTACLGGDDPNAPRPSAMRTVTGNGQSVAVGQRLMTPLSVRVVDQYINNVEGETIRWEVTEGGGTMSPATSVTNGSGIAESFYTAGTTTGLVTVTATLEGLGSVPFEITVTATPEGGS